MTAEFVRVVPMTGSKVHLTEEAPKQHSRTARNVPSLCGMTLKTVYMPTLREVRDMEVTDCQKCLKVRADRDEHSLTYHREEGE